MQYKWEQRQIRDNRIKVIQLQYKREKKTKESTTVVFYSNSAIKKCKKLSKNTEF